ncbi:hypothetical protein DFQ27_000223 [Actinomortierella ambigua]|uniref:Velvet domain-containing protein n=1 Tax=Actinomortierella ambigua TaxID=1343610 RepID=A0A9P6QD43_9FUNG|nr:hypothetical protein DFQ27_000223 [Actinomortierella ambigua]
MSLGTQSSEQTLADVIMPRRSLRSSGRRQSITMTARSSPSSRYVSDDGDMATIDTDISHGEERESKPFDTDEQPDDYPGSAGGGDSYRVLRSSSRLRGAGHHHLQTYQVQEAGSLEPTRSVPHTTAGSRLPAGRIGLTDDPQGQYARNLVGGVAVYGQLANDLENELQMWFAFSTISIRTEGFFTIRFCLTELSTQGQPQPMSPILYTTYSDRVHVQSPKRFQGTCDNNALATHLNKQGIRVPTRKDEKKIIYRGVYDESTMPGGPSISPS